MMKNIKLILLAILFVAINHSCNKFDQEAPTTPINEGFSMTDIDVPNGFDWKMTTDYEFYISGGVGEVVKITSVDETVVYHKGTYIPENGSYKVSLRIPSSVNTVKINSASVDLGGTVINHNLSTKAGLINYTLEFDGVDDYVDLGDIAELNNVATFTVEGWANQTLNTADEYIFRKRSDHNNDIRVRTDAGTLYVEVGNGSDSYAEWTNYSATLDIGAGVTGWFHWAVVYDGAGGTDADRLKLYINGNTTPITLAFTGTIPATTSSSLAGDNASLSIAALAFTGYMDEIRIWSTARTPTEINDNYNILIDGGSAGLEAYYRMNEGTGTTTYDETSNDYDATISGCTWGLWENEFDTDQDTVDDLDDDYWEDDVRAYDNYYPAADTGTVAFEDLWPGTGDYDFNDLVIGYQFKTVTNEANEVVEIFAYFEVRAHGAQLNNGFGFQLPDADPGIMSDIEVSGYSHTQGTITINGTTKLESGQTNPVVIVMDDVVDLMDKFENTPDYKAPIPYVPITITMTVTGGSYTAADFSVETWDPFMFIDQIRGYEVHQLDYPPTDLVNPAYFGTFEDASDPGSNEYYRTATGLPWVLEFPTEFEYPFEKRMITYTYLHFKEWAESAGTTYNTTGVDLWYEVTDPGYRNGANIYH